ncbi:helix-turn-helix domain-containing protein [Paenibacillus gansuensis]|uniref:Helix-turn-helix domain-containing protein n=1 Tax=Paenibacillus gansuensis TaxID=306542 RepID=A0ABW5PGV0_9BACL
MIGHRIRALRQERKLSLSELAERAGVAKSYLSNMERDIQSNPSIQFLEKISEALHVSVDDILQNHPADAASGQTGNDTALDQQWAELVREAMNSGVSKEQFREFLEFNKWRANQK